MRLDLHCHSTCSDGSLSPSELAKRVHEFGVELFCLTDHDTLSGYSEVRVALPDCNVLRGLELSCRWEGRNVHLLVYGVQVGRDGALQERLTRRRVERLERMGKIVEKLAALGKKLDLDALIAGAEGRTPGRPDIAKALVDAGVCSSVREAFDRFLRDGGPADVAMDGISVSEGLELASDAGAKVSLAHPHTLRHPDLAHELLRCHRERGLEGLEACYGRYTNRQRKGWMRMATELNLVVTGGSDYHGDTLPQVPRPGIEFAECLRGPLLEWLEVA